MKTIRVVIDTNILVSALRSSEGASYRLLSIIDSSALKVCISTTLLAEYEDILKRTDNNFGLTNSDIDDILDYICKISVHQQVFYLWRPFLKDSNDDMILELAVAANADYIITYNKKDFSGIENFSLKVLSPKELLRKIGEIK